MLPNVPPELIWFLMGFILLLGELVIPAFIFLFFGIGAWITSLAIYIGIAPHVNSQLLIFILTSVAAIVLLRRKTGFLWDYLFGTSDKTDLIGSVIGSHGIVVDEISPQLFSGKIELNGTLWQAISDVSIKKGIEVEVIEQNNLTVKVKPLS